MKSLKQLLQTYKIWNQNRNLKKALLKDGVYEFRKCGKLYTFIVTKNILVPAFEDGKPIIDAGSYGEFYTLKLRVKLFPHQERVRSSSNDFRETINYDYKNLHIQGFMTSLKELRESILEQYIKMLEIADSNFYKMATDDRLPYRKLMLTNYVK